MFILGKGAKEGRSELKINQRKIELNCSSERKNWSTHMHRSLVVACLPLFFPFLCSMIPPSFFFSSSYRNEDKALFPQNVTPLISIKSGSPIAVCFVMRV